MPTALDRIQCLLQPDSFAKVMTLAKLTQRSKSFMASELIDAALALPIYKEKLEEAADTVGTVPTKADPRGDTPRRQPQLHRVPKEEESTTGTERFNFTEFYEGLLEEKQAAPSTAEEPLVYVIPPGEGTPNGLVSDGKGGLVDPTISNTEDDQLADDLRLSQMARPVFTYEEQQKMFELVKTGVITKERLTEIMEYQAPAPDQTKEELQAQKRIDLLNTLTPDNRAKLEAIAKSLGVTDLASLIPAAAR